MIDIAALVKAQLFSTTGDHAQRWYRLSTPSLRERQQATYQLTYRVTSAGDPQHLTIHRRASVHRHSFGYSLFNNQATTPLVMSFARSYNRTLLSASDGLISVQQLI
jgi:hypothetical protein